MTTGVDEEQETGAAFGPEAQQAEPGAPPARKPGRLPDGELSQSPSAIRSREKRARERKRREKRRRRAGGEAPPLPGADDVPASLRRAPGARDRAPKRPAAGGKAEARALREQTASALRMLNQGFLAFAPCTCDLARIPEPARGIVHFDNCVKLWALDPSEVETLTEAIAGELEAHPELATRMLEGVARFGPHVALAMAIGGIAIARAQRQGSNLVQIADTLPPEAAEAIAAMMAAGVTEAPAAATPPAQPFTEAAAL